MSGVLQIDVDPHLVDARCAPEPVRQQGRDLRIPVLPLDLDEPPTFVTASPNVGAILVAVESQVGYRVVDVGYKHDNSAFA